MTDNLKVKANKGVKDCHIAAHSVADNVKTGDPGTVSGDSKFYPQDRNSEVTASIYQEKITCPQCGKSTLHAEFPDHYEA